MSDRIKCTCKHEFQDKTHGQGVRVATVKQNGDKVCTVCGKVQSKGAK